MIKKIYISGKITGDPNYREKFAKAEEEVKAKGYMVMNPAILPEGFSWVDYMEISFAMMKACDAIYLLEDWEDSAGACLERQKARDDGLTIFYQKVPK